MEIPLKKVTNVTINRKLNGHVLIHSPKGCASIMKKTPNQIGLFIEFPEQKDYYSQLADSIDKSQLANVISYNKEKQSMIIEPTVSYDQIELALIIANFF